ncbi:MAG: HEAT repeat domain-containing protein [Chloroflexota bacterium]
MGFRFPSIDNFSFLLGFILATVFWAILSALRPLLRQISQGMRAKREETREKSKSTTVIEEHYRQRTLEHAQGQHLAAQLFSLDEIIIPPALLAPPPRVEPNEKYFVEDIILDTIPYLPSWPEFASFYNAPTITLGEALSGDSDIVLAGHPGAGKTVALAHLASCLARRDQVSGLPDDTLPFFIHIADLKLPLKNQETPLEPIIEHIVDKSPVFESSRIPDFIRTVFSEGRAILLLDGTDEITPDQLQTTVEFIRALKKTYPETRIVTTAFPEFLDGLVSLNFIPFTLAGWTPRQINDFLEKWADLWQKYIAIESWAQSRIGFVDPTLLNRWITIDDAPLSPLEITLRAWGAYAGDGRGPRSIDAIEAHIRRLITGDIPREAVNLLGLQVTLAADPIFDPSKAREWVKSFEPPEPEGPNGSGGDKSREKDKTALPSAGILSRMASSGLLAQHRNNRMRFLHPVFTGYLAGKTLSAYKPSSVLEQKPWIGKLLALNNFSIFGDAIPLVHILLAKPDPPLQRNLLLVSSWLRDAPKDATWRLQVLARLVELLKDEGQPLGLRGQAMAAFILARDANIDVLFRQLLRSNSTETLQLAALACGALRDQKAIEEITALLRLPNPSIRRAACLALVAIGTTSALESVADALLHGDDNLRRTAAEALANHPEEGYAMLRDGAAMEDILVRRGVVYGLGRIKEVWADTILEKLLTDDQWIVRNSATEVLEAKRQTNALIPKRLVTPSESPWLIAFAGKQGLGIAPDKPATDVLLLALKSGSEDERLASLSYLRMMPTEGVFGALYQEMYSGNPTIREAVFRTFWEMAARGVTVPDPLQFGIE